MFFSCSNRAALQKTQPASEVVAAPGLPLPSKARVQGFPSRPRQAGAAWEGGSHRCRPRRPTVLPRPRAALFALLLFPDLLLGVVIEDSEELEEVVLPDTKGVASKRGFEPGPGRLHLSLVRLSGWHEPLTHAHTHT